MPQKPHALSVLCVTVNRARGLKKAAAVYTKATGHAQANARGSVFVVKRLLGKRPNKSFGVYKGYRPCPGKRTRERVVVQMHHGQEAQ
jgi:hypothetical protein